MMAITGVAIVHDYQQRQVYEVELTSALTGNAWSYARFPLKLKDFEGYTSPFGERVHPISGQRRMHWGLDVAVNFDKPVLSWWNGTVEYVATTDPGGCGKEVFIRSGRWTHRYCHLNGVSVKEGDKVEAGQQIGLAGSTGSSNGPHLHWEIQFDGKNVDPSRVIKAMQTADNQNGNTVNPASYEQLTNHKHNHETSPCNL